MKMTDRSHVTVPFLVSFMVLGGAEVNGFNYLDSLSPSSLPSNKDYDDGRAGVKTIKPTVADGYLDSLQPHYLEPEGETLA
eukprot:CAMPEP_0197181038 /NCGR_PEP_ID=MMETSP1423-20130617/5443_1 /TAXON_ID=476441 /ORGANISM="Pseudo-nitzschia heimii, Strain UNC1101" /LENGTH=80 /DNA_ID=CAMNT_0042631201 /DNA_START=11 /DNA_END=249 /DNA_ORIENTATION=+